MARQIVWTEQAQRERKQILEYWNLRNGSKQYSRKLNVLIKSALSLIANRPLIGKRTTIDNVRMKVVRDYFIFYEIMDLQIIVLTIWDSRQNPESINVKSRVI